MDYIDLVYVAIKDREPCNILMSSLKEPEKFISAVKFLIDGGWITNVHWDSGFYTMTIEEKFSFENDLHVTFSRPKSDWYSAKKSPEINQ